MQQQRENPNWEPRMVEMIALRGHVTTDGEMVLAGHPFTVAEDEANRYRVERPHLAVPADSVEAESAEGEVGSPAQAPRPRRKARK